MDSLRSQRAPFLSADVDTGETEDEGGRSVCNKGQERKEMGGGGVEFKKRIITLKKMCFIPHQQKGMFHLQRPKGLSAPLSLDFMKKIVKKIDSLKKKIEESNNEITLGGGQEKKSAAEESPALQDRKLDLNVTFPSFSKPGLATTEMSQCG